jgi:hypothetical protein
VRVKYQTHAGRTIIRRVKKKQLPRIKIDLVNWLNTVDDATKDEILTLIDKQ